MKVNLFLCNKIKKIVKNINKDGSMNKLHNYTRFDNGIDFCYNRQCASKKGEKCSIGELL